MNNDELERVVEERLGALGGVIAILEAIQSRCGYLPESALRIVAAKTGHPLTEIYAVATFYRAFSLKPRGKHLISVCLGTACHVRGAPRVAQEFSNRLGIRPGDTTAGGEFSLETVNCLGACALGPTVVVDGRHIPHVTCAGVARILDRARAGAAMISAAEDERNIPLDVSCPACQRCLLDARRCLDDQPAVRLRVRTDSLEGEARLSSLYGTWRAESVPEITPAALVSFACPHCGVALPAGWRCPECGVRMVMATVRGGAEFHVCARWGCKGRLLDLNPATLACRREQSHGPSTVIG